MHGSRRERAASPPRNVTTSVDEIEEAFQRRKKRELEQARMAGSRRGTRRCSRSCAAQQKSVATIPALRSGKKYKKCCGAQG